MYNNQIKSRGKISTCCDFIWNLYHTETLGNSHESSLRLLSWYRDRILHNGNKLPSLWLLDYLVTQRFIPIINDIVIVEKEKLGQALFYLKTVTEKNIIDESMNIKFEFKDIKSGEKVNETYINLLKIGQIKELGRANLNMNLFVRNNRAAYEYNYHDPKGRGKRFAIAEKNEHPKAKEIKKCPCCGEESLVMYETQLENYMGKEETLIIQWVKCYTCDYHLRYNVGDPHLFNLSSEKIFND